MTAPGRGSKSPERDDAPDTPEQFASVASARDGPRQDPTHFSGSTRPDSRRDRWRPRGRARDGPPYRPPASQKAGVDAPVRIRLGGRVPRAVLLVRSSKSTPAGRGRHQAAGVGGGDARTRQRVRPSMTKRPMAFAPYAPVRRHAPRTGRRVRELLRPFGAIGAVLSRPQLARYLAASNDFCFRHRW